MRRDTQGPGTGWDYAVLGLMLLVAVLVGLVIGRLDCPRPTGGAKSSAAGSFVAPCRRGAP